MLTFEPFNQDRARDVRCECRACGSHLVGTISANGVQGRCSNCFSHDVAVVSGAPIASASLLRDQRRAAYAAHHLAA